ncbi:hypothetical protein NDU88_006791, partial [Pleurodeles waltl]
GGLATYVTVKLNGSILPLVWDDNWIQGTIIRNGTAQQTLIVVNVYIVPGTKDKRVRLSRLMQIVGDLVGEYLCANYLITGDFNTNLFQDPMEALDGPDLCNRQLIPEQLRHQDCLHCPLGEYTV